MLRVAYVQLYGTKSEADYGQLEDTLVNLLRCGSTELDMLVWMSRVSLELIGQAGIGVSFDTLSEASQPSEHVLASKQLMCAFVSPSWPTRRILTCESDLFRFLSKGS